jgi:hypothetical protein
MQMIREVEELAVNYEFEFGTTTTLNSFNSQLNNVLADYVTNGACSTCTGTAYQTAYDKQQKTCRVSISVVFNNIIERILVEFDIGS